MSTPLLTTKLHIHPVRPNLVRRPRLLERLNAGMGRSLTIVSAPAGFGKTALISDWVAGLQMSATEEKQTINRIAWLSLDEGDDDYVRFLTYLVAALQSTATEHESAASIGKATMSLLQSAQPLPSEAVLTPLLNEISTLPDRIILILDDYHLIETEAVHDALAFLVEHVPRQMHLAIVTRGDPPLPMARLRAQGELTELRAADLRFSSTEIAEFLNQSMHLDLSAEHITALEDRTEGWIAGLQMAAISIQGSGDASSAIESFTGSHRYVLDYLIEEVLSQQSENVQSFLMRTAVLDRLNGSLCDTLTDRDDSRATLEMLDNANLFIVPLDSERNWYRYHRLFADLLRQRLRQTQSDLLPALHLRASEWYDRNGFADEAIEHALRTDNLENAANLIQKQADVLWARGEHTKLRRWLRCLPVDVVFAKPGLCIFHAWMLFANGLQEKAQQSLQAAEGTTETSSDAAKIRGRAAAMRAFMASHRGDVPGIIEHAQTALEYLPRQDLAWRSGAAIALGDAHGIKGEMTAAYQARLEALAASKAAGNNYMTMMINLKLAINLRQQGQVTRTVEMCQQQVRLANEDGIAQTVAAGGLLAAWGEALAELNDLDAALHRAKRGVELTERGTDVGVLTWCYVCLARVLLSRGDLAGAEEIVLKMKTIAQEYDVPSAIKSMTAAWQVRVWLAHDKVELATQWAEERGPIADEEIPFLSETEYVVLSRVFIALGWLDEADALLMRLLDASETRGHTTRLIEILILQASSSQTSGDIDRALATLAQALALAETGGFVRIFVDEGPSMAHLLYEAVSRGIAPDYARGLLSAFPSEEPKQTESSTSNWAQMEPLSERELEVLPLIAEGLTNQEIGSRLFVSLNTIKVHTRNIYGKLAVHSRTQAVGKAIALGILPTP